MAEDPRYHIPRSIPRAELVEESVAHFVGARVWSPLENEVETDRMLLARISCLANGEAHWV